MDCNPVLGQPPALEWVDLADLKIDESYQRDLSMDAAQTLIRDIARNWDWRLCQPLNVSRREDETLYVVDGQHRLSGARLRSDVPRLPCVIIDQSSRADEATTFIKLNKRRRALNAVDVFKAQLASGLAQSVEIDTMIRNAGLTIAPHSNYTAWKPGMLFCVPGITAAYRRHGGMVTSSALVALQEAFDGQVLRYAGQLLRGLVVVYATEGQRVDFDADAFIDRLGSNSQQQWMRKAHERIARTGDNIGNALAGVMIDAYRAARG